MSAAQEFLNDKLSKNKYTVKQQQQLDANGGASVVGSSDGVVPTGEAYAKTSSAGGGDKYRGFGQDSDSGRNYSSGAWGSGDLDAAGLAAKYNLDTSQEGRGEGHIWGRNKDGSEVYIGKSSMDLASNKDLISAHSGQANSEEDDHSGLGEKLSSSGDIKGAILTEWAGGKSTATAAEPEKEHTPIVHSPEVKQATERVRAYEDNILSGKTSNDIFSGANNPDAEDTTAGLTLNNMDRINDKYNLQLDNGAAGIGTPTGAEPKSTEATESFLNAKKTDIKKAYNFQPKSDISYGAN
jgi:hypothetical protein